MRLLFVALFALTAAVVAGHFVAADPGFVVIGYGGKVVRTTFAFFLLASLVGLSLLYAVLRLLVRVFELRRRWRRWSEEYRRRRAHRSLANGMLALAAGDFARAERLFNRGIDADAQPEVHYLAAAEAAQAMRAPARRDNYLRLAHDVQPEAAAALDVQRAAWLLENGQLDEARAALAQLERTQAGNPQVLNLRMQLYRHNGDMRALLGLIPALRRDRVIPYEEANALERDCAAAMLGAACANNDELSAQWAALSKAVKAMPAVLGAYVRGLCRHGRDDEAETLLRKQLEKDWDSGLAELYGDVACEPPARQLRKLDGWAVTRGEDAGLRFARARVALRAGLWGPARTEFEALVAMQPTPLLHRLLAEAAEGAGDLAAAAEHRRRGLDLATAGSLAGR